jgi:hypothetical protein
LAAAFREPYNAPDDAGYQIWLCEPECSGTFVDGVNEGCTACNGGATCADTCVYTDNGPTAGAVTGQNITYCCNPPAP